MHIFRKKRIMIVAKLMQNLRALNKELSTYWKCNFLMNPYVRLFVWSVDRSIGGPVVWLVGTS